MSTYTDPTSWGISWSQRIHRFRDVPVEDLMGKRTWAPTFCGASAYLVTAATRGRLPSRLAVAFDSGTAPVCRLCLKRIARRDAAIDQRATQEVRA